MPGSERGGVRLLTAGVGLTCLASASWLACSPRAATKTLHLPESEALAAALATRDLTIGVLLLIPSLQRPALLLRAGSDAFDAGLMTGTLIRGQRRRATTGLFIAGALALSGLGWALRARLPPA